MRRFGSIGWAICAAVAALVLAPDARAADPPTGAVISPWHSPAGNPTDANGDPTPPGTPEDMPFTVSAHGTDLTTATLYLGNTPISQKALCDSSCTDGQVQLPFSTAGIADDTYDLRIVVADAAGNVATALDDPGFQVWNYRPSGSSTATLSVGSSVPQPSGSGSAGGGSSGGVEGASAGSCTSPKLSMVLDQRPLRIRHGVPVLVAGKRYRFSGRLTCVINGRRVSAPKRTRIDVRAIVGGRSVSKGKTAVGAKGKIVFRLASESSRTLEFRFTNLDGKVTRVRIKVVTVHVKKKHKKG